ncbi:MAG: SufD family Fe-S cluster assembly protein [Actinomycetota bacterium]
MNDQFGPTSAASMDDGDRRLEAARQAAAIGLPRTQTEEWRYSPIGELPVSELAPVLARPGGADVDRVDEVQERAATVVLLDGWVVDIALEPGWAEKGLSITTERRLSSVAGEATMFDHLHHAFSPETLVIATSTGLSVRPPIVIASHQLTSGVASFPHIVVEGADGSDLTIVEQQTSSPGFGLNVPVVELAVGPSARVRYQTHQDLDRAQWQLARQLSTVGGQATLTSGIAAFGAHYARVRTDSRLAGRGSTGNLVAAYYGDGDQTHDFRTFQHHDARDSRSDLLFKGAQDDASGSIYTGLIHIHPDGAGANAFQTNRNIKLSPDAWAWSVPNLEIENNDVHCSHASTVSPIDEDQQFYLGSRGVPPITADRLIVAGFFDEVIRRLPVAATHDVVRRRVSDKLDGRMAS